MKEWYTALLGFAVTPIVSGMLFAVAAVLFDASANGLFLVLMMAGVLFSYVLVVVAGIPLFLLFRLLGPIQWWKAALSGSLIGCIMGIAMAWPTARYTTRPDWLIASGKASAILACVGGLSALVFWSIWRLGTEKPTQVR